jgi:hypothetical protein
MNKSWTTAIAKVAIIMGAFSPFLLEISCKSRKPVAVDPPPAGWVDWATPDRVNSLARMCALNSKVINEVTQPGGRVHIESRQEEGRFSGVYLSEPLPFAFQPAGTSGARRVRQTKDGWLVGFNSGEFGGSLWYLSPDGSKSKQILNENVTQIAEIFGRVYVVTNAAGQGLGFRGGAIYEVADTGEIKNHLDFEDSPLAFVQESTTSILIVSDSGIHRVSSDLKEEQIFKRDLSGFSSNSIVVARDKTIYIGMNFFVLRLIRNEKSYKEQWLVPSACKDFHVDPEQRDCICDSQSSRVAHP